MKLERGLIQVYTGNGKGKTTAALGLAFRAAGRELMVCMIQFMKGGGPYGEHLAAPRLAPYLTIIQTGREVILDEINGAVGFGLIRVDEVLPLLEAKPHNVELVLTGRNAHERIMAAADLVTEMREVKHYYKAGVPARTGIEK